MTLLFKAEADTGDDLEAAETKNRGVRGPPRYLAVAFSKAEKVFAQKILTHATQKGLPASVRA